MLCLHCCAFEDYFVPLLYFSDSTCLCILLSHWFVVFCCIQHLYDHLIKVSSGVKNFFSRNLNGTCGLVFGIRWYNPWSKAVVFFYLRFLLWSLLIRNLWCFSTEHHRWRHNDHLCSNVLLAGAQLHWEVADHWLLIPVTSLCLCFLLVSLSKTQNCVCFSVPLCSIFSFALDCTWHCLSFGCCLRCWWKTLLSSLVLSCFHVPCRTSTVLVSLDPVLFKLELPPFWNLAGSLTPLHICWVRCYS